MEKNKTILVTFFLFLIFFTSMSVNSQLSTFSVSNPQLIAPGGANSFSYLSNQGVSLSSVFAPNQCNNAGQDFIVQIAPFGCEPAVVRSDLLTQQNVPVFCQLAATKLNPLINVKAINTISFKGQYPPLVAGVGFHPAQAAVQSSSTLGLLSSGTLLNSPILGNIGYVVIVLKQQVNESSMPSSVSGNLTATLSYNVQNAFGVGQASYYIPQLTDDQWNSTYNQYGFWSGKGFLRTRGLDNNGATISIYTDKANTLSTLTLAPGQTSGQIYLPGFYCQAGFQLKLDGIVNPDIKAKLDVNGNTVQVGYGEKFLNNVCRVVSPLNNQGFNQQVQISCTTDTGTDNFNLNIAPKIKLDVTQLDTTGANGQHQVQDFALGDKIFTTPDRVDSIYLGYIGSNGNSKNLNDMYIYLISMPTLENSLTNSELASVAQYVKLFETTRITGGTLIDKNFLNPFIKYFIGVPNAIFQYLTDGTDQTYKIEFQSQATNSNQNIITEGIINPKKVGIVIIKGFSTPADQQINSPDFNTNFQGATTDYNTLITNFPNEKSANPSVTTTFGQQALLNSIRLAFDTKQNTKLSDMCKQFQSNYPTSTDAANYCNSDVITSNTQPSQHAVVINGVTQIISFNGIYEPSVNDYGVQVVVSYSDKTTQTFLLGKDQLVSISEPGTTATGETIQLHDLSDNTATFITNILPVTIGQTITSLVTDTKVLTKNVPLTVGKYVITVNQINLNKVAQVEVVPFINNVGSQSNFTFNIGIEKSAIQLSPNQIQNQIKSLNQSIDQWQGISNNLGSVVEGFNAACLAVGTTFTIENLVDNLNGGAIARQEVMRGAGGWFDICQKQVSSGQYNSVDTCLLKNSDQIQNDVNAVSNIMQNQQPITDSNINQNLIDIRDKLSSMNIVDPATNKSIPVGQGSNVYAALTQGGTNIISLTQARDIQRLELILNSNPSPELQQVAQGELAKAISNINANSQNLASIQSTATKYGIPSSAITNVQVGKDVQTFPYQKLIYSSISQNQPWINNPIQSGGKTIDPSTPIAMIQTNQGDQDVIILDATAGTNMLPIKKDSNGNFMIYDQSGNQIQNLPQQLQGNIIFQNYDSTTYTNTFINPQVQYFETTPYKGLPAIVPFDLNNGWYVAMKQVVSGLGNNIQAYDKSGKVTSFYLCNVGSNGKQDFNSGIEVDPCRSFDPGVGQILGTFPGLSPSDTSALVTKAVSAVQQAANQYKQGVTSVTINGRVIPVGNPASNLPDVQCQDFMSPQQCNILFNTCDPVVCPPSRCDLGGTYHVSDVIQSGIIGSIALCLPNYQNNIAVPICLSGVKAGMDSLISVQKSYRDCLQQNLATGKNIGICDEVHSVYLCDFFWSQTLPISQTLIPRALEYITGQGNRGGGEYMGVQSAWNNAQNSVNYLTNYYGAASFEAFKTGVINQVGQAFCGTFISGAYPNSVDALNSLLQPKSPPQFTGWFSEAPFTTSTVPPISQYKVYYHIYAGSPQGVSPQGAYYSVYLKSPTGTSYFQTNPILTIGSGFIGSGSSADNTSTFTAPSGYTQMCIKVNAQEQCGFNKVSTEFALNYANNLYLAQQGSQTNINSQSDCISGTPSAYSLINPNIQAGLQQVVNPNLYTQIVRVCSTNNPGQGTNPYAGTQQGRWIQVGTCDNGAGKINCYLDTQSVNNSIHSTTLANQTLQTVQKGIIQSLTTNNNQIDIVTQISKITSMPDPGTKITYITSDLINSYLFNSDRAELYFLRAQAYAQLAVNAFNTQSKGPIIPTDILTNSIGHQVSVTIGGSQKTGILSPIPQSTPYYLKDTNGNVLSFSTTQFGGNTNFAFFNYQNIDPNGFTDTTNPLTSTNNLQDPLASRIGDTVSVIIQGSTVNGILAPIPQSTPYYLKDTNGNVLSFSTTQFGGNTNFAFFNYQNIDPNGFIDNAVGPISGTANTQSSSAQTTNSPLTQLKNLNSALENLNLIVNGVIAGHRDLYYSVVAIPSTLSIAPGLYTDSRYTTFVDNLCTQQILTPDECTKARTTFSSSDLKTLLQNNNLKLIPTIQYDYSSALTIINSLINQYGSLYWQQPTLLGISVGQTSPVYTVFVDTLNSQKLITPDEYTQMQSDNDYALKTLLQNKAIITPTYNLNSALDKLNSIINTYGELNYAGQSTYATSGTSGILDYPKLVNALCIQNLLTPDECSQIKQGTTSNLRNLLQNKINAQAPPPTSTCNPKITWIDTNFVPINGQFHPGSVFVKLQLQVPITSFIFNPLDSCKGYTISIKHSSNTDTFNFDTTPNNLRADPLGGNTYYIPYSVNSGQQYTISVYDSQKNPVYQGSSLTVS